MDLGLSGKRIVITGGCGFIGQEITRSLVRENAKVVVSYSNPGKRDAAEAFVREIEASGGFAAAIMCDVKDKDQIKSFIAQAAEVLGGIDMLVNSSGVINPEYCRWMTFEQWEDVISINLTGVFLCSQAVIPYLANAGGGAIVNISSISAEHGSPTHINYSASKAGVHGMTVVMAKELGPLGIRVNSIAAGPVQGGTLNSPAEKIREMQRSIPVRRLGKPSDVASLTAFLLSEKATFITGQNMVLDGGLTL